MDRITFNKLGKEMCFQATINDVVHICSTGNDKPATQTNKSHERTGNDCK